MDINLNYNYKNAPISVIVEDDCITTAKTYIGGELIDCYDIVKDDGSDVPFCKANLLKVVNDCRSDIDAMWEEEVKQITA